jgi:hypothetical protein
LSPSGLSYPLSCQIDFEHLMFDCAFPELRRCAPFLRSPQLLLQTGTDPT